ncbi:dihydropteridine reductase [Tieghemostelium lacteum]|uniref:Dihydropteridine reductase n=1 Tax=Tieghemostelium lacteum TaxID=361077 RepID=A0A151ZIV2_TIELA|nr:dihydropteridine reductase [Tieghemostelium lacteum]|eukprot:KYQ93835.1 dihydropteridine reductase [Tieghemostelium lacteum]
MSKNLLILGGSGALGSEIITLFKNKGWKTISIDFRDNTKSDISISITSTNASELHRVEEILKSTNTKADTIVCAAGGWVGGNAADEGYLGSVQKMIDMNLYSAFGTAFLGSKFLNENGLLVLTGANAALQPTSFMIAYGATKAATHHLIKSLAQPDSGLPNNSTTVGILPITLDTPINRTAMPNSNFDDWTPLSDIANKLYEWSSIPESRPTGGSLLSIITKNKVTTYTPQ